MHFLEVLSMFVLIYSGFAPQVSAGDLARLLSMPGNNDHYIEGESRWIWMESEMRELTLVDLFEASDDTPQLNGSLNAYWLFTRDNKEKPDVLLYEQEATMRRSNFKKDRPITILSHGWWSSGEAEISTMVTAAILESQDVNVIVVDWRAIANLAYASAVRAVPSVGECLGRFIIWLLEITGSSVDSVHLVGHSLGAHVIGVAGTIFNGTLARATALDPAGPLWKNNPYKVNKGVAVYVEVIHTDGNRLGLLDPVGNVDIYPNGGQGQPGCSWLTSCSHSRAYELFAVSVNHKHLVGRKCKDLDEAKKYTCQGVEIPLGNNELNKTGEGLYSLITGKNWLFNMTSLDRFTPLASRYAENEPL